MTVFPSFESLRAAPGRLKRIRVLLVKELAQIRRDRSLFGILLIGPIIQLVLLGYAATTDVREIGLAVRDNDHTFYSREYVRAVSASGWFKTVVAGGQPGGDDHLLVRGSAGLVLTIPAGFGRELSRGRPVSVQILADGADSNFAVNGINYILKASRLFSERMVKESPSPLFRRGIAGLPGVTVQSRAWYNPGLISRRFMVPGVMGMLLLLTTMIVTSMALVKEREDGTMEQLIVTPLRPSEIMIGKLLPFVGIGLVEITLALSVMWLLFDISPRGSLLLLYLLSGLFLLTTLGMGLLISTLVKTQQQAMMTAAFFVMLPFVLLSGFIFPVENMPPIIQAVTHVIPLKYYLIIVRGLFLKGAGWTELWGPAAALAAFGVAILGLAILKFHKRLD